MTERNELLLQLALSIIDEGATRGAVFRLFGGLACWLHCQDARHVFRAARREMRDVDLVTRNAHREQLTQILLARGFQPDPTVNSIPETPNLCFYLTIPDGECLRVDVALDALEYCHSLPIGRRLENDRPTLPLAELLLSKLQNRHLAERDIVDVAALLLCHPIGSIDDECVNACEVARRCASDWGLYRTITDNLRFVASQVEDSSLIELSELRTVHGRIEELLGRLAAHRKSLRWRSRGIIHTLLPSVRWYRTVSDTHAAPTEPRRQP